MGKKDKKDKVNEEDILTENAENTDKSVENAAELAEFKDKFLRLYSEFDNYRKRTNQEKLDIINTASESVILSILPTLDNFERAIKANENANDIEQVKKGFELIYSGLMSALKQKGLEPMNSTGEKFDTDYHEAVTFIPAETEEEKGLIFDEIEKGYKLKDKVIRFAKVVTKN